MKNFKLFISFMAALLVLSSFSAQAKSGDFGVVDLSKVVDNYTEAQKVSADLKVKETDIQKFLLDAQKKVKAAKTPLEKKNLEEKFGEEFNIKRKAFIKEQTEKWEKIENTIFAEIEELSKRKKFEMVFNKQSVIVGGTDITEELIKKLNQKAKK